MVVLPRILGSMSSVLAPSILSLIFAALRSPSASVVKYSRDVNRDDPIPLAYEEGITIPPTAAELAPGIPDSIIGNTWRAPLPFSCGVAAGPAADAAARSAVQALPACVDRLDKSSTDPSSIVSNLGALARRFFAANSFLWRSFSLQTPPKDNRHCVHPAAAT